MLYTLIQSDKDDRIFHKFENAKAIAEQLIENDDRQDYKRYMPDDVYMFYALGLKTMMRIKIKETQFEDNDV